MQKVNLNGSILPWRLLKPLTVKIWGSFFSIYPHFLLIFTVVTSTGYSYHFNPLLGVMKWHFYKVGTPKGVTYVLITKKELRHASQLLTVAQLTEYIVIDLGGLK